MAVVVTVRSRVKDYDVWRAVIAKAANHVAKLGVISSRVLRDLDDPNVVILHLEFADPSAARAIPQMHRNDAFREGPVEQGVLPETIEVWIGADA
jgi:hypothetical protein